ncbi:hypothetical protein GA830_14370 [Mesorhizobium sp. NBSH29]|uniref:hypothetical protein n=1 Tax=Mesorhizobium sp. NBSH29 TaxID=2654249 RepID=UPI0018967183|nr:hypothetical protein [Mesorhizobium sp. NBSH29]QPC87798.1 hypothetical protein GA830_14370 [Mesorhizobium sp. NBSH29]
MNPTLTKSSAAFVQTAARKMKPNRHLAVIAATGDIKMIIFMLAAAMTIAMLIATVFGIHHEAQSVRMRDSYDRFPPFGTR